MARLTAQNITKMFGTDVVLADVSFEIQDGEHIGLVGINGSGKTTLFKILTGEYDCDSGLVVQVATPRWVIWNSTSAVIWIKAPIMKY